MATVNNKEKSVAELQTALSDHARSNNRKKLIQSLHSMRSLSCILLDPVEQIDRDSVVQDVISEQMKINGVTFFPCGEDRQGRAGGGDTALLRTLRDVCKNFCKMEGIKTSPRRLQDALMVRMARTGSAADSYFRLNSLLGSPDLMVMPLANTLPPPTELEINVSGGSIHADITSTNFYGLYRKADLKGRVGGAIDPTEQPAWVRISAIVHERINFGNGRSVRYLRVVVPNEYGPQNIQSNKGKSVLSGGHFNERKARLPQGRTRKY